MALPPQAVEKLIQEPVATQGVYKELLLLAGSLLALMLVLYFGIAYGYEAYLNSSITKLNQDIAKFGERIPQADQERTAQFYSALVNLRELLKAHTTASPVLNLLERVTGQNIYYTKLNLNANANEADLAGVAKGVNDAASLAALLERQPEVTRVNFTNVSNQNGAWIFTMSVFLDPSVMHANGLTSPNLAPFPAASSTLPASPNTTSSVSSTTP